MLEGKYEDDEDLGENDLHVLLLLLTVRRLFAVLVVSQPLDVLQISPVLRRDGGHRGCRGRPSRGIQQGSGVILHPLWSHIFLVVLQVILCLC